MFVDIDLEAPRRSIQAGGVRRRVSDAVCSQSLTNHIRNRISPYLTRAIRKSYLFRFIVLTNEQLAAKSHFVDTK